MKKLPDVNVWLALALSKHTHHPAARAWLDAEEESASLCFCRATQQALLRLLTTKEVLARYGNPPLTNREAWAVYERFREDDRLSFAPEPEALETSWKLLAIRETASPKVWMDAYLAAFAISGRLCLTTLDLDFKKFSAHGLDVLLLTP